MNIIQKLDDLIYQSIHERSHLYTADVLREAKEEIVRLSRPIPEEKPFMVKVVRCSNPRYSYVDQIGQYFEISDWESDKWYYIPSEDADFEKSDCLRVLPIPEGWRILRHDENGGILPEVYKCHNSYSNQWGKGLCPGTKQGLDYAYIVPIEPETQRDEAPTPIPGVAEGCEAVEVYADCNNELRVTLNPACQPAIDILGRFPKFTGRYGYEECYEDRYHIEWTPFIRRGKFTPNYVEMRKED